MKLFFICLFITSIAYQSQAQIVIKYNDPHIRYSGRIAMQDSAAVLSWSGSSVRVNFEGTGISFKIKDERGDNYFNEIVDGKVVSVEHQNINTVHTIAVTGLTPGRHTFELYKRNEWAMGKVWIYQVELPADGHFLTAPPAKKRKIEFFGDSITCGYADEDTEGKDRGTSPYENGYFSYAAITARHFDAELHNTSKSGIGVLVSWFPLIMPEMYDRLDATDPNSKWDFNLYTPQLVVINLFQNDSWITKLPDNTEFKTRFGTKAPTPEQITAAYAAFVKTVRAKYPKAQLICALGSMDATSPGSPWPGYIDKAVASLNDPRIHTHFFPVKAKPGHPSVKEQQDMADDLIAYIDQNIKW